MVPCYVALGGNVGGVGDTFADALTLLRDHPRIRVLNISSTHTTRAVGSHAGGDYLNAAAALETDLAPEALLDVLQDVETRLGRIREVHWGPRTLDLDLLFYGSQQIDTPRLRVPHPAAWYRRFVLDPLVEIAPEFIHPVKQATIAELQLRLCVPAPSIALAGATADVRIALLSRLRPEFPKIAFSEWRTGIARTAADAEPTFIVWLGAGSEQRYEDLPLLPRVNAMRTPDTSEQFVRHLIQSAFVDRQ